MACHQCAIFPSNESFNKWFGHYRSVLLIKLDIHYKKKRKKKRRGEKKSPKSNKLVLSSNLNGIEEVKVSTDIDNRHGFLNYQRV